MRPTKINDRWELLLPEHRAARVEWPVWEQERLAAMRSVIEPGDVVYDIGAEEGDLPALWASWGAEVVLVEPNPKAWPNIRAVFEANALAHLVRGWFVGFAGETERAGEAWFADHVFPDHRNPPVAEDVNVGVWPACAFGPVVGDHGFLVLSDWPNVPVTTIDRIAREVLPPSVITIDVEGEEMAVLHGALNVLSTARPAVFLSVHVNLPGLDEQHRPDTGEVVAGFMQALGYRGVHLATDHEEHWVWRHPEGR